MGQRSETPFLETSDNVGIEAFRRAGDEIEIRLAEMNGVVPEAKRKATHGFRHPELKGHPPRSGVPEWVALDK